MAPLVSASTHACNGPSMWRNMTGIHGFRRPNSAYWRVGVAQRGFEKASEPPCPGSAAPWTTSVYWLPANSNRHGFPEPRQRSCWKSSEPSNLTGPGGSQSGSTWPAVRQSMRAPDLMSLEPHISWEVFASSIASPQASFYRPLPASFSANKSSTKNARVYIKRCRRSVTASSNCSGIFHPSWPP